MQSDDIDSMREALAALTRAPALKASFGVERVTVRADLWKEHFSVQGVGKAALSTVRSFGDTGGDEIGRYQSHLPESDVDDLVRAASATLDGGPGAPLAPGDVRVLITLVACGSKLTHVVGGGPEALAPYTELLAALDRTAFQTRQKPVCTLKLDMELPHRVSPGTPSISVVLTFSNRGSEGTWIRSPAAGMEDVPTEHVRLWYAALPQEEPGVTPLPMEPEFTPLVPSPRVQRPLLWLGPGDSESRQFVATPSLDPGSYLVRASFASYAGDDSIGGQNLLRGCVFSPEQTLEVCE
jgi:hypothetical protein